MTRENRKPFYNHSKRRLSLYKGFMLSRVDHPLERLSMVISRVKSVKIETLGFLEGKAFVSQHESSSVDLSLRV